MKPKKKLFQVTAILYPDGYIDTMGGTMANVRAEAAKTPGARAIVVREVPPAQRSGRRKP
jgi:hypothetical protein